MDATLPPSLQSRRLHVAPLLALKPAQPHRCVPPEAHYHASVRSSGTFLRALGGADGGAAPRDGLALVPTYLA